MNLCLQILRDETFTNRSTFLMTKFDKTSINHVLRITNLLSFFSCREVFNITHALSCPNVGYTHITPNEIYDSSSNLLSWFAMMSKQSSVFRFCEIKHLQIEIPLLETTFDKTTTETFSSNHKPGIFMLMQRRF